MIAPVCAAHPVAQQHAAERYPAKELRERASPAALPAVRAAALR
jgi:hypothetical protein